MKKKRTYLELEAQIRLEFLLSSSSVMQEGCNSLVVWWCAGMNWPSVVRENVPGAWRNWDVETSVVWSDSKEDQPWKQHCLFIDDKSFSHLRELNLENILLFSQPTTTPLLT